MLQGFGELAIEATPVLDSDAALRSIPCFAGLGPVLMVRCAPCEFLPGWRICQTIDSFGVREYLECGALRLHRLPDSDYLGWERIAHDAGIVEAPCRSAIAAHPERIASTVWVRASRVEPVVRLSSIGWHVVQSLLRIERARLVDAVELC